MLMKVKHSQAPKVRHFVASALGVSWHKVLWMIRTPKPNTFNILKETLS
jgi:hypothetical protein